MHKSRELLPQSTAACHRDIWPEIVYFHFLSPSWYSNQPREALAGSQAGAAVRVGHRDTAPSALHAHGTGSAQLPSWVKPSNQECRRGELRSRRRGVCGLGKRPDQHLNRVPDPSPHPHPGPQIGLPVHTEKAAGPRLPCSLISCSSSRPGVSSLHHITTTITRQEGSAANRLCSSPGFL